MILLIRDSFGAILLLVILARTIDSLQLPIDLLDDDTKSDGEAIDLHSPDLINSTIGQNSKGNWQKLKPKRGNVDDAMDDVDPSPVVRKRPNTLKHGRKSSPNNVRMVAKLAAKSAPITAGKDDEQLLRILHRKRQKLRKLRQEISGVQNSLRNSDYRRNGSAATVKPSKIDVWQRAISREMRKLTRLLRKHPLSASIQRQLRHLVAEFADAPSTTTTAAANGANFGQRSRPSNGDRQRRPDKSPLNEKRRRKRPFKRRNKSVTDLQSIGGRLWKPATTTTTTVASINSLGRSNGKRGEHGSFCATHKDCKPGLCCHKINVTGSMNVASAFCVEHRLGQGRPCVSSCQCDSGMQCFISRKDKLHHKRLSSPANEEFSTLAPQEENTESDGRCKIPSTDDVLHGVYVIGDYSVFKAAP